MSRLRRSEFLAAGTAALAVVALPQGGTRSFAMAADERTTTLGSWLRMWPDGTVEVFTDKVEVGMGVATGLGQFVADELDVPFSRIKMMLGDTDFTVAAGGVGGSNSTFMGNFALRNAAAQMRRILVNEASARMGIPADKLTVSDGVIHPAGDTSKSIKYTDIVAALFPSPTFPLRGDGFTTDIDVPAKPKDFTQYKLAGSSVPRLDAPGKAYGHYPYVVNVKLPGMMHGRMIYPPAIGATVQSVDEASIHGIGDARVVRVGSFVGVVATREWHAVKAARALKVTWSAPSTTLPAMDKLADYMWAQQPFKKTAAPPQGNVDAALASGAYEAKYFWPFQTHANMDPGCSVVDVRPGAVTVWSGTQKTHALRQGIAKLLKVPPEQVRVVWVSDAGSYGRGGLEESAAAAAYLSHAVGRPVRVQSMRADNTQWGNKAPAIVGRLSAKVQNGSIVAFDSNLRQFNGNEIFSQPSAPGTFIAAQLAGVPNDGGTFEYGIYGAASGKYEIPNTRATAELIAPFAPSGSPLRTAHLRDPQGPGVTFIIESFIDELAAQAKADAVAFRVKHLRDQRHIDAIQAAAKAANWETRPSATAKRTNAAGELIGRGVAFATRGPTIVATVAEVAVNPKTGKVRVPRIVAAQDCGFIVNPKALQGTIEANVIQSLSRSIYEEVTFNDHTVTSKDWRTYPVAHMRDVPAEVKVVMINRPSIRPGGAGEPTSRTTAAAIGNAIYDATGVRMRTAPFTPKNVLAALTAQSRA
ncbi:MAG TPA: molybdopterin cofactor-binding domain-containing protein [Candidatus Binatia bacterium]|nr:molybdopterin cofactor-binding domain-containing protein [Candidatus Binatia bacterium]